jgi:hypothetical protein
VTSRSSRLLRCGEVRGPALVLVAVSFAVLVSDGCAGRHYRVIVTETVPSAAYRRGAVTSSTPDALTPNPTAEPLNSLQPSAAPPSESVATSGDERPLPQGMLGSYGRGVQPHASIARAHRPSRSHSSSALAEQSRSATAYDASPVLVLSMAAAVLVGIFMLRWGRRDRTLLGR